MYKSILFKIAFLRIDESLKTIPYYSLLTDNEKNTSKCQKESEQRKVISFIEGKESEEEEQKEEEEGGGPSVADCRYAEKASSSFNTESCSSRYSSSSSSSTSSYCSTISIYNNGSFNNNINNTSQDDKTSISTVSTMTTTKRCTTTTTTTDDDMISNTMHSLSVHDAENKKRVSLNNHRTTSLSGSEIIIRTKNETEKGRAKEERRMKNSFSSVSSKQTTEIQIVSTDEEETRQDNGEKHKPKKYCRIIRRTESTPSDSEQLQRHLNKGKFTSR
ncbi:unnamed protein product [Trichobilharzia regenti]|nr:unnamed protein product [Trichobilharzia regenti]